MSYALDLSDLRRDASAPVTQQVVDRLVELIDDGALEPGARLPSTRALAATARINHLTAARVYRRLADMGYVTAAVGSGTFVRRRPPSNGGPDSDDWQHDLLLPRPHSHAAQMLAEAMAAGHGRNAIPFAAGFPDPALCPSSELAEIATRLLSEQPEAATGYLEVEGVGALREQLAAMGRECGFAQTPEEILVTTGARQGLDLVARALLGPDDVAAVESPTFAGTLASLQATGARVLGLPVDGEGADIGVLERILARHEVKLVVVQGSCQNPTGADLSAARRRRLLELARERGFFVLDDGVYATIRYEGPELPRLRAAAPSHVIYVDSLSKSIGGGLRVGWVAASGPVFERLVQLKLDSDIHSAALPQHLAARYLAEHDHRALLARALPVYRRRRDTLIAALGRHLDGEATWSVPDGGHHVWVTLRRPVDERALYAEALDHGTSFLPGGAVQAEPSPQARLRLGFSLVAEDDIDEGIRRLASALRAVRRRQKVRATTALS
jgi:DNA-binding transcriptional MocR family regulator